MIPGTLHSTRAAWLGSDSSTDLRSVRKAHRAKQVQYLQQQENIFFASVSP
jgi:hypothetical protein